MPYISKDKRKALDQHIDDLAAQIVVITFDAPDETAYAGLLNYTCSRLAMKVIDHRFGKIRYGIIATVVGLFHNIADEFYRRVGIPYENKQLNNNGDVDLYEEYAVKVNERL